MQIYRINIPHNSNAGQSYANERAEFEQFIIEQAGGFTQTSSTGAWQNDQGLLHREAMEVYDIACDENEFDKIVVRAIDLFADQISFFTATVGVADFIEGHGAYKDSAKELDELLPRTLPVTDVDARYKTNVDDYIAKLQGQF